MLKTKIIPVYHLPGLLKAKPWEKTGFLKQDRIISYYLPKAEMLDPTSNWTESY